MNPRRILLVIIFVTVVTAAFWIRSPNQQSTPPTASTTPTTANSADTRSLPQQMTDRFLALIHAESDPVKRETAAQEAARHLPRALLPAVLAELKNEADRSLATEATRAILLRWAWEEPSGAAAWTMQHADGDIRRDALAAVGSGWARQNPEALLAWTSTLAPDERDWVLLHGASYLARTDLSLFSVWLKTLPPTRELTQLTAQTAREWAARNPQTIITAISEFSGPEYSALRKSLADGLANQLSQADHLDTAFTVLAVLPPGAEQTQIFKGVVIGWSQRDPSLVATWLDGVADPSLRREASTLLAGAWFEHDAAAAEHWATALPPGPIADAVAERAAQYFAPRDRAIAQRWTDRITSQETRHLVQIYVQATQPLQAHP